MSEHAWSLENIAAHVAGGLDAQEAERLERHAAECPECAAALRAARALDHGLDTLFAAARPAPALEDRLIRSLRTESARVVLRSRWRRKLAWGAAAAVALGVTGAGMSRLVEGDALPFPGRTGLGPLIAANNLKNRSLKDLDESGSMAVIAYNATPSMRGMRDPEAMARELGERFAGSSAEGEGASERSKEAESSRVYRESNTFLSDLPVFEATPVPKDTGGEGKGQPPAGWQYFKPGDLTAKLQPQGDPKPSQGGGKEEPAPKPDPDKTKPPDKTEPPKPNDPAPEPAAARKVIRSGEIEFEVESFDGAVAAVTKLVTGIKGAFVATVNSDKLANGKVKGSLVVRVPPDSLDSLVLDLRKELGKNGELKGQRIGSKEITKEYTDLESRLKAAKTMEQRLLQIIKDGKGEIKQLLDAEKALGEWRTKIEELEGEIRYYANLVALSTLTVTLAEKEIRAAAEVVECERVQAGIEVEDVDKAQREALAAVAEAKGRVTKAELKQQSAGQFSAVLQFEVAPDAAGPLRDRLKQLGNMVRLEIDRVQQPEGGTTPPRDAKVKRGETRFSVHLYNLANVAPRETATVQVAVADVPAGYRALQEAIARAKGRVVTAQLNEQDRQNVTAQLDFEVRRADEPAIQAALSAAGEVLSRNVSRAVETENVTDGKVLFKASLVAAANIKPRESVTLGIEVADVDATKAVFAAQVAEAQGRTVEAQVAHERGGRVTGRLVYDVPLSAAPGLVEKFKTAGTVRVQQATRNPQAAEGKLALARIDVTLSNADLIVPKDDGLWPQVRKGLSYSVTVLSLSVTWLIFGLCVVLPWALVGYGGYRLVRRLFRAPAPAPGAPAP